MQAENTGICISTAFFVAFHKNITLQPVNMADKTILLGKQLFKSKAKYTCCIGIPLFLIRFYVKLEKNITVFNYAYNSKIKSSHKAIKLVTASCFIQFCLKQLADITFSYRSSCYCCLKILSFPQLFQPHQRLSQ